MEIGPRVAEVDDEQIHTHAIGGRQGRAHAQQPPVGRALLGERLVDLLEVAIDLVEELARFAMVDLEAPPLRALDQLQARTDRQPAGDFSRGHPAHPVGYDEEVAVIAGLLGEDSQAAGWSGGPPACG